MKYLGFDKELRRYFKDHQERLDIVTALDEICEDNKKTKLFYSSREKTLKALFVWFIDKITLRWFAYKVDIYMFTLYTYNDPLINPSFIQWQLLIIIKPLYVQLSVTQ